jgi:glycosyltransferase involved in cell wall biosynthesis
MDKNIVMISIGMPVYNGEKFIREALDSLLAQTESNFELIISDNASTDATEKICREYSARDKRISYIRHEKNGGPLWNFNFVLQQAQGEYFMWAAHDDLWDKSWVTKLLNNHSYETAISFGHVVSINEDGELIRSYPRMDFSGSRLMRLIHFYLAEDTLGKPNIIYGIYKTDMLKKIGFKEYGNSQYGQDMQFIFGCLQYGGITTDPSILLYKRVVSAESRRMSFCAIISSIFILPRIGSYFTYPLAISKPIDQIIIGGLSPIKYLLSFIYSFVTRLVQHLSHITRGQ